VILRFAAVLAFGLLSASCVVQPPSAVPSTSAPEKAPPPEPEPIGGNLLKASDFQDGKSVPWMTSFTPPASGSAAVEGGAYCVTIDKPGENPWDAQFRHRELVIEFGHDYTIEFKAWASEPTTARPKLGMAGPPYAENWSATIELTTQPQRFVGSFQMLKNDDPTAEFAFHVGGRLAKPKGPFKICIDDIHVDDPKFKGHPSSTAEAIPVVLVNQVGYLPNATKIASVKSASTSALDWKLEDAAGKELAAGKTQPFGADKASGDSVHLVDFSAVKSESRGVVLRVGADSSHRFDIAADVYDKLRYDALAFFYHNRAGIEITAPYAGDPSLARPAGHLSDKQVKCWPKAPCDYALDVSKGWYDAGDHGKYVVNGGISVWTLLNQYERAKSAGPNAVSAFADGKLVIPENKNGIPDLLDEVRWELEFLLGMQVPEGKPLAGMAHHKIHDEGWTGLAVAPHEDKQARYLHAPSTAATLNLAATAAQAARVWKGVDAAFSARCLTAAERAFAAAQKQPKRIAPESDTDGGGAYGDGNLEDEFYWAAAELWATTGKPDYKKAATQSPRHAKFPTEAGGQESSFNWGSTDALGMISLLTVPGAVDKATLDALEQGLVAAADRYLAAITKLGYRTPLSLNPKGEYVWGSNSFVLNNAIVLALAHDLTRRAEYRDGVVLAMDYILGRNPLGQSYVTGYGEKPLKNPHHRFFARQVSDRYPAPPAGIVSGGPNSKPDDPYSQGAGLKGCVAQKCFVDHIEAYTVNEVTINWNAPLAWVSAWLAERARN
jgi:endoglucanase